MKSRTGIELTEQDVIDSPHVFIGSLDRFVEKFTELRERLGISSFLVGDLTSWGRSSSGSPARDRRLRPGRSGVRHLFQR